MHRFSDAEIETQRLEDLQDERDNHENDRCSEAGPGTFYAHEALHMCAFLMNSFYEQVLSTPTVLRDPEMCRLAYRTHELMYVMYQKLGEEHLSA